MSSRVLDIENASIVRVGPSLGPRLTGDQSKVDLSFGANNACQLCSSESVIRVGPKVAAIHEVDAIPDGSRGEVHRTARVHQVAHRTDGRSYYATVCRAGQLRRLAVKEKCCCHGLCPGSRNQATQEY